jgi:ribosomal protein S18 acetylase RimI-like enzyme
MLIRPLRANDAGRLAALYAGLPEVDRWYFRRPPGSMEVEHLCTYPFTSDRLDYVAELVETGEVIGWGFLEDKPWAEPGERVLGLLVRPDWRGRGLGRALLQTLKVATRVEGLAGIRLTVAERNARAVRLYESSGFRRVDRFVGLEPDGGATLSMRWSP